MRGAWRRPQVVRDDLEQRAGSPTGYPTDRRTGPWNIEPKNFGGRQACIPGKDALITERVCAMSEQLGILFLILFVIAAGFCIYLALSLASDRSKTQSRIQAGIERYINENEQRLATESRQSAQQWAGIWFEQWKREEEKEIRSDAVKRSQDVTRGKVTEHIVPYLPGFDFDPKDIRFLGTPIDLIAFKGLNSPTEDVEEIVFIEIKTGRSALSSRERAVKRAVEEKRVAWRIFNPDEEVRRQARLVNIVGP
jgi:predicted Holliday junction resolvase-like endonuclease